jgi:hypothetical protein
VQLKNTPAYRQAGICYVSPACRQAGSSFPVSSTGQACCGVHSSTPHFSGFREPCIWAFLSSLSTVFYFHDFEKFFDDLIDKTLFIHMRINLNDGDLAL